MNERTLKPIRCRLCRKPGNILIEGDAWCEVECGCGVYAWAEDRDEAVKLWNRLMRVKK